MYTDPPYGGTHHLVHEVLVRFGVRPVPAPAGDTDALVAAIRSAPDLGLVLVETPANPTLVMSDIAAAGGDADAVRRGAPAIETDAMVAYAYDTVMRRNPAGFFGMVYVLEGTSAALALNAAESIQRSLGLPGNAFTYLRSHGKLDQQHVGHLASIVDRLDADIDLPAVVTCARTMFRLYGDVFRSLDAPALDEIPLQGAA